MSKKNNKWPEIGIITKNEKKDKDGNVVKDKQGNPVTVLGFKLADNVTILVDGKPVETSRYGILTTPVDEVERLYKNGAIGDDKIEERRQSANTAYKWLRYKIQLPPPKAAQE
jgi:hypothetical protein